MVTATAGWTMAAGCPCCPGLSAKADGLPPGSPEWGYTPTSPTPPPNWPGTCAVGYQQSPVNLPMPFDLNEPAPPMPPPSRPPARFSNLDFRYNPTTPAVVVNPGHGSMQVNFDAGHTLQINNEEYDLLQYHFHTPSEHALDGARYAMEVHLVHKSKTTGGLAVVGVLMEPEGQDNPALACALDHAPAPGQVNKLDKPVDPMALLPSPLATTLKGVRLNSDPLVGMLPAAEGATKKPVPDNTTMGRRPFVHYPGSLTTPPCSETVEWFVMTSPIQVGAGQILRFQKFAGGNKTYGQNARPLQPWNRRSVDYEL